MNKPPLSVITTSQEAQPSRTGMQGGGHGLAMLVGLQDVPKHPDPELARRMMGSLRAFSAQLPEDEAEAALTMDAIWCLETPATRKWIAARIVTLLSHYFVAQQEASVADAVAEDWCSILDDYPAWAIANACRWWLGRENPRRHCKPIPGDVQDRAHHEMDRVRAAKITVRRGIMPPRQASERAAGDLTWCDPAEVEKRRKAAEEIMAGFRSGKDFSA